MSSLRDLENPRLNLEMFNYFNSCIAGEENINLIKVVREEQIFTTLSQINSLKAPGSYSLQANFYQKY